MTFNREIFFLPYVSLWLIICMSFYRSRENCECIKCRRRNFSSGLISEPAFAHSIALSLELWALSTTEHRENDVRDRSPWRRLPTYQKLFSLRACRFLQIHVLRGTIFPHDSSRIYQDNRHGCQRKQILNLPDEQSRRQDRRTRKALMHTIACVQSREWCAPAAIEADRLVPSPAVLQRRSGTRRAMVGRDSLPTARE